MHPKTPFWKRLLVYRWHLVLITLEAALAIWIRHNSGFVFRYLQVERDKSWWTLLGPYAAPFAGLFGGIIVFVTYICSHKQKQEHFERQALDTQFTDILNRLASNDPILRANAAIRLAEMAEKPKAGKLLIFIPENYPFFARAASQLAAALHMEQDQTVRGEVRKALSRMTEFAKKGETLLHLLISELADANRSAKTAFVKALPAFGSQLLDVNSETMKSLAELAPFCEEEETTRICLHSLTQSKEYCATAAVHKALRGAQTDEERASTDKLLFPQIRSYTERLIDTREALAISLRALASPAGIPSDPTVLRDWVRDRTLSLKDCFLAGADLRGVKLPGACLDSIYLQGANLNGAQLQKAHLYQAKLQAALLREAQLQEASPNQAQMQKAALDNAACQGANFAMTQLQGAILREAKLPGTNLYYAQLHGTELYKAIVKDGTGDAYRRADFTGANWQEATFTYLGLEDQHLQDWLNEYFPYSETHGQSRLQEKTTPIVQAVVQAPSEENVAQKTTTGG